MRRSGVRPDLTFHDLRHYYASLLIRHGESVKVVQRRLGHKTAQETSTPTDTYGPTRMAVALIGLRAARHLSGDIYEVGAEGQDQSFRILFAPEAARGQVLLALDGFSKKTQKTPPAKIRLAQRRLADWRERGAE